MDAQTFKFLAAGLAIGLGAIGPGIGVGLLAMGAGWLPNVRPVVIGAIHFLVLGPLLASMAPLWLQRSVPVRAWCVSHLGVVLLAAPLLVQGLGAGPWNLDLSALGGSVVLAWWLVALPCALSSSRE